MRGSLHARERERSYKCDTLCRHFEVEDKTNEKESSKIFSVPDFVGDACKAIASRVRGAVAGVQFDDFHKVCNYLQVECLAEG